MPPVTRSTSFDRSSRLIVPLLTVMMATAYMPAVVLAAPGDGGVIAFSSALISTYEDAATVSVSVFRSGNTTQVAQVDYTTVDGTATAGTDYAAVSGTLTFVASDTSETIVVSLLNDTVIEGDEAFYLELSVPPGQVISVSTGSPVTRSAETIATRDHPDTRGDETIQAPTVPIDVVLGPQSTTTVRLYETTDVYGWVELSSSLSTPYENAATTSITVNRLGGWEGTVTVDYTTVDGTATAGTDYTATSGTLTLVEGDTAESFTVPLLNDTLIEGDENFYIQLSNPSGGVQLGVQTTQTVRLYETTDVYGWVELSSSLSTPYENAATTSITVNRLGGWEGTVTVDYTTVDGTATAGTDYTATSGTLTLVEGDTAESFTVPLLNDTLIEGDENFYIQLSNPSGGVQLGVQTTQTVRLYETTDVYGWVELSSSLSTPYENAATTSITVNRLGGWEGTVTVDYTTVDGTATAGTDYTATSGTLTLVEGDTAESFTVPLLNDTLIEGDENFYIQLSNPSGGVQLGVQTTQTVRLYETTDVYGWVELSSSLSTPYENAATTSITVNRLGGWEGTVTVDYTTVDGTATAGTDYTATSGTLTLVEGDTAESFTVPLLNDTLIEGDENFYIQLSNPSGGVQLGVQTTQTVRLYETTLVTGDIEFYREYDNVWETDATASLRVDRSGTGVGPVSVDYTVIDGTATNGADYSIVATGTISWVDGDTGYKYITPAMLDDALIEGDETFQIVLSNPGGGATLGDQRMATVRIYDNDDLPGLVEFYREYDNVWETDADASLRVGRYVGDEGAVSVDYTVIDGTATNGADYSIVATGTISWVDGDTGYKYITPAMLDDALIEGDETFQIVLSNPGGGATLGDQRMATVRIYDNDDLPGLVEFYREYDNVWETDADASLRVGRYVGDEGAVSVDYTVIDGTATNGADYSIVASGTISWVDGDTGYKYITPAMLDDALIEGDETFQIVLSNPGGGATLGDQRMATVRIYDNDDLPGLVEFYREYDNVWETDADASLRVGRYVGDEGAVSVDYTVIDGTATNGADYSIVASGTISWVDGDTGYKYITPAMLDDALIEGDETFQIVLSNPGGGATLGDQRMATVRIYDNDDLPGLVEFYREYDNVWETDADASLRVGRYVGDEGAVSVDYTVIDGTATNGADYSIVATGTISWVDGDTGYKYITPALLDDALIEGDETFQIVLSNPGGGATLGDQRMATVRIYDNEDNSPGQLQISGSPTLVAETVGRVDLTVVRVAGSAGAASVDYTTVDGTATNGSDYTTTTGTLTWTAGDTSDRLISVPILSDTLVEGDEDFVVTLSNFVGAGAGSITSTIVTIVEAAVSTGSPSAPGGPTGDGRISELPSGTVETMDGALSDKAIP